MRPLISVLLLACCAACTPSTGSGNGAPAADHRFVTTGEGSVRDTTTGLVWTADDGGQNLAWKTAEQRCAALRLDGRDDWRLPSVEELVALYDESESSACGDRSCRLDPAITLTDPYVWSGTERGPGRRFYIDFKFGTQLAPLIRPTLLRRVLCVRGEPAS